jgi:endonuclease YncB( thermonuclease family)
MDASIIECATFDSAAYFTFEGLTVDAKVVKILDGDTLTAVFQGPDGRFIKHKCRLDGIDTPEMNPPLSDPNRMDTKRRAIAARDRLVLLVTGQDTWSTPCDQHSRVIRMHCKAMDKYGRLLVDIPGVVETLIAEGHGVPYFGRNKRATGSSRLGK